MPLITYMDECEIKSIEELMDKELRKLCDEIKELTGRRYVVKEHESWTWERYLLFFYKRKVLGKVYTVFADVGLPEVQCIHLMTGFGGGYSRAEAGAFLIGVLLQAWEQRKQQENNGETS